MIVWQWEAAAQLRCSAPGVATLLTTRDQAIARRFAGAQQSVNVPVLAPQPAHDLLYALAPEVCDTDPTAAHQLAALIDGLPLALETKPSVILISPVIAPCWNRCGRCGGLGR